MKNFNGYYNLKVIAKFTAALKAFIQRIKTGDELHVTISGGNVKMGDVASVSLLPFLTCPARCHSTCAGKCYAAKIANLRKNVMESYAKNTALAHKYSALYWHEVNKACAGVRFFRFHVSGDIINYEYFENMVKCAKNNVHCEMLAFTKNYEVVNKWIDNNSDLPENLHVLFSGWANLKPINPHNLPETNVILKGAAPAENWKICGGNCFDCGCRGLGCWQAVKGDVIAFHEH